MREPEVLCGANSYEQKYYLNQKFKALPESIRQELQILCVLFTEEIGGILLLKFDEEGDLQFEVTADPSDYLFDEIGSGLKIRQLQREKRDLFSKLELYYKAAFLGMTLEEIGEGQR